VLWGQAGAWDYNTEGVLQFGSFGTRDIRAWTLASNTGYTIGSLWGQPRLGLQADAASGGGPGGALKDFYPLFPKYAYFTEAQINAPINMVDLSSGSPVVTKRQSAMTSLRASATGSRVDCACAESPLSIVRSTGR
jgi:alginate export protein